MLAFLDILFFSIHIIVISFNLLGWVWKRTRKLHFWVIILTLASWLLLGIRYGLGYCFLTDWHWNIKRQLGEQDLPHSFIQYLLEALGIPIAPTTTDYITVLALVFVIIMSIYFNFFTKSKCVD